MRHIFFSLIILNSIIFSCDDGDILNVEFDFEDTFNTCEETDLVFYKTKTDPTESLSVVIPNYSINDVHE